MPGCPVGTEGCQWWRGASSSRIVGDCCADPRATDGGAAADRPGVCCGRGCGRAVLGRGLRGLGPLVVGQRGSSVCLTHTQCYRKGLRCGRLRGPAGGAFRQRCRQSIPGNQGQKMQNQGRQEWEGGRAERTEQGIMIKQWHMGHEKHAANDGRARGRPK